MINSRNKKKVLIFGAGKIARGFINHLLFLSNMESVFVEKSRELTNLINEKKQYSVNILGASDKNMIITGAHAVCLDDEEEVIKNIENADLIFTSIGGKNLESIVPVLAKGLKKRILKEEITNIITCENWKKPAEILKKGVLSLCNDNQKILVEKYIGFAESVVLRSGIEATDDMLKIDPLIVNVQNYYNLPIDASKIKGELPSILGVELMEDFGGFLERKFYTYNAANGTVAFIGSLLGYTYIHEAAFDPFISDILEKVYNETSKALCNKHNFDYKKQKLFALSSLNKLRDKDIIDTLERNARDPIRKLSFDDRLIGSARMVLENDILPEGLAVSIACACFYDTENDNDDSAKELKEMRQTKGIDSVLRDVCKIAPNGELGKLVKDKIIMLKDKGIIKESVKL